MDFNTKLNIQNLEDLSVNLKILEGLVEISYKENFPTEEIKEDFLKSIDRELLRLKEWIEEHSVLDLQKLESGAL